MPGSEEITITFKYDQPPDEDIIEYWHSVITDFYDGSIVKLIRKEQVP